VRDFALTCSNRLIWDAEGVDINGRNVLAMSGYTKEGMPLWDKYSTAAVAHTLKVYGRYTFDYPYPVAISALGLGKSLKSNDLISKAVDNLLPAMKQRNIKRLVFISAFGVGETFKQASFVQKTVFKIFLRNLYADKQKADDKIMQSELDWTLVYPVLLTNKSFSGSYKTGETLSMKGMPKLSRADLADFIVSQLTDLSYIRKNPIIMK